MREPFDSESFVSRLKEAYPGHSVREIASKLGYDKKNGDKSIHKWGKDAGNVQLNKLLLIRQQTGVSIDWLLFGEGSKIEESALLAALELPPEQTAALRQIASHSVLSFRATIQWIIKVGLKALEFSEVMGFRNKTQTIPESIEWDQVVAQTGASPSEVLAVRELQLAGLSKAEITNKTQIDSRRVKDIMTAFDLGASASREQGSKAQK